MIIYAATANKHKLSEMRAILPGVTLVTDPNYEKLNVEENGAAFEENASIKAVALSKLSDEYVIADDSGISVDVLDGAPGVYSARYAGKNATDRDNNLKLLNTLAGEKNRRAKFICVIALARSGKVIKLFHGEYSGSVGYEEKGSNGFGYDPLFITEDGRTMAELSPDEKNRVSHRRRALEKLSEYLINAGLNE